MAVRTLADPSTRPRFGRLIERPIIISKRPSAAPTMTVKEAEGTGKEQKPSFICDFCGLDKPVVQVFQCTVCLKDFCVTHIGTWAHECYQNE